MLNPIKLYDGRSKILKFFEDKNIKPSNYPHNAKFEAEEYDGLEVFKPKEYEDSTKMRRQKKNRMKKILQMNQISYLLKKARS